jgi:hypothetical protein
MIEHPTKSKSKNTKKLDFQFTFDVKNPKENDIAWFFFWIFDIERGFNIKLFWVFGVEFGWIVKGIGIQSKI